MKKLLSFLSLILIIAIILSAFTACGNKTADTKTNGEYDGVDEAVQDNTDTEDAKILPNLPEADYDGYTFTFLSHCEGSAGWDWVTTDPRELVAEEETEEPISDAVYRRNEMIKEKYNIDIKMTVNTDEKGTLSKAVRAGDDIYDAVVIYNNNVPGVVTSDLLLEVSHLTYLDLDKPWWDEAVNAMSVAGKQYLLAGDLLILDNEATSAIIFNKDLMATLGLDLPYNLVKEGKWTMDKLAEFTKGAELDLNGDGKFTYTDDRYGFMRFNDTFQAMLVAGGGALTLKDENDIPYISFATDRNLNVLEKVMDTIYTTSNPSVFNVQSLTNTGGAWENAYYNTFREDRALFMWIRMRVVEVFRDMDSNFGVLPMPKYDENQAEYSSLVNSYTGVLLAVPKTAGDPDRTSVILEALAAESKYTLQPAYYDITLQRKFTRDDESSEMLDIIFSTRTYDIGGVYDFGGVFNGFLDLAGKEDRNIASYHEKKIGTMQKAIEKTVAKFESMD